MFGVSSTLYVQVNTQMEGKGPLHLAIVEGFVSILKTILKFRPDLDMEVSERVMHECLLHVAIVLKFGWHLYKIER